MTEALDTEIVGNPTSIEAAAAWIRERLKPEMADAADAFNDARRSALQSWNSVAGDQFAARMNASVREVDVFESAVAGIVDTLDIFAARMRTCATEMSTVRSTAQAAGLAVVGFAIAYPGDGPAPPAYPLAAVGQPVTREELDEYTRLAEQYEAHQGLLSAFAVAKGEVDRIDQRFSAACEELQSHAAAPDQAAWSLDVSDVVGDGTIAAVALDLARQRSALRSRSQDLIQEAADAMAELQAYPERFSQRFLLFHRVDPAAIQAEQARIDGLLEAAQESLDRAEENFDDFRRAYVAHGPAVVRIIGRLLGPSVAELGSSSDWIGAGATGRSVGSDPASPAREIVAGAAKRVTFGSIVPATGTTVGTGVDADRHLLSDGLMSSSFSDGPEVGRALDAGRSMLG
ncbi:MAG: hypothetical protein ACK5LN_09745 [Propioniciclava sp.]